MRLAQVILFAKDVDRMLRFYRDTLGLPILDGSVADGFVRLDAGGCALALHATRRAVVSGRRSDVPTKLAFHADDVDAERARLVAAGTSMDEIQRFDGIAFCDGVDPEGNVFQVTTRTKK